jgi:hypothetical protein
MTRLWKLLCLLLLALPGAAYSAGAHESYLDLNVEKARVQGEWKVRVSDLDAALQLDANRDGEVTWPEMLPRQADIEGYLNSQLALRIEGADAGLTFDKMVYGAQDGEALILTQVSATSRADIQKIDIDYALNRALLKLVWSGKGWNEATLSPASGALTFTRDSASGAGFTDLLKSGVWHIWIGFDHVLFLLVLLIPAVFQRTAEGREGVPDFGGAFARVIVIVSAFTIAHSITLTAAAMQWIVLPGRLVESAIAASVFVAALLNFLPTTAGVRGAWLAFGFGLLHGFGFAGVLSEVETAGTPLWRTLVAFNLGVELGQLAIVAAFLPLAYILRNTRFYRTGVVYGGSSVAGLCALLWFWRRAFS